MNYLGDSSGDLIRAVDQELAMVHPVEDNDSRGWVDVQQMIRLGFGDKGLLRPIPEFYVLAMDRFEFVSVDILVSVTDSLAFA